MGDVQKTFGFFEPPLGLPRFSTFGTEITIKHLCSIVLKYPHVFVAGPAFLSAGVGGAQQLERGGHALQGVLHGQRQRPRAGGKGRARKGKLGHTYPSYPEAFIVVC